MVAPQGEEESGFVRRCKKLQFGDKFAETQRFALAIEQFDSALQRPGGDRTGCNRQIRDGFAHFVTESERILLNMQPDAIAIAQRFGHNRFDRGNFRKMRPLQRLAQNAKLHFHLRRIAGVLIVAAPAFPEVRAGRLSSGRARLQYRLQFGIRKTTLV